jgi:monothiol glutaredoxin
MADILETIKQEIETNRVVLFMKGSKTFPQCGFSARVVQILNQHGVSYETRNVLEDPALRQGIKDFSSWPTVPQLYVDGKFIGGCDIVNEMDSNGDLATVLGATDGAQP